MKTLESGSVDAVVTDPPYGIDYQSAWRTDKHARHKKILNDKVPATAWIQEAFRLIKDGGCCFVFCRWDVQEEFKREMEKAGLVIKSQCIWDRGVHGMGDLDAAFAPQHDTCWFGVKGKFKFFSSRPTSILRVQRVNAEEMVHPNQKPLGLMMGLIEALSPFCGVVLDPFAGSGTTGVACKVLGRDFIGIELDVKYFNLASRRIETTEAGVFSQRTDSGGVQARLFGEEESA